MLLDEFPYSGEGRAAWFARLEDSLGEDAELWVHAAVGARGLSDDHAWILLSWIEEIASSIVRTRSAARVSIAALAMALVLSSGLDRRDCSIVASLLHRSAALADIDYVSAIEEGLRKAGLFAPDASAILLSAPAITPSTHLEKGAGGSFGFERRATEFDVTELQRWLDEGE